jgi:hypothetical protein
MGDCGDHDVQEIGHCFVAPRLLLNDTVAKNPPSLYLLAATG